MVLVQLTPERCPMSMTDRLRKALFKFLSPEIDGQITDRLIMFWDANFAAEYTTGGGRASVADREEKWEGRWVIGIASSHAFARPSATPRFSCGLVAGTMCSSWKTQPKNSRATTN